VMVTTPEALVVPVSTAAGQAGFDAVRSTTVDAFAIGAPDEFFTVMVLIDSVRADGMFGQTITPFRASDGVTEHWAGSGTSARTTLLESASPMSASKAFFIVTILLL